MRASSGQPGHCLRRPGRAGRPSSTTSRPCIAREIGDRRGEGATWATWAMPTPTWASPEGHRVLRAGPGHAERSGTEGAKERLGNLGLAYADLGEATEGHRVLRAGPGHRPRDRRPKGRRSRLGNLGTAYADLGDPARPSSIYEQALAIAREIGDRRGEGTAWATWAWPTPTWASQEGHRVLRAGPGHRPRDRRPKGRRKRAGQPGQCLRRPGRAPQGHRVLRAAAWPSPERSETAGARQMLYLIQV